MDTFLTSSSSSTSSLTTNNGALGSSCLKHARSGSDLKTTNLGLQKVARTTTTTEESSKHSSSCRPASGGSLFPGGTQMLSFSSPGKERFSALSADHATALSSYQHHHHHSSQPSDLQSSCFGYGGASLNNGVMSRIRGPFTPSQWMELEHQALIYKYIVANAPVPTTLLISIRRSLIAPAALSPFASFASNPMGWGSLHLAYAGSTDPEPGRCRRTDGKKWRCSRDAVPDQKYCERHINRGRHRSRKHVEGRNANAGQAPIRPAPAPVTNGRGSGAAAHASAEHLNRNLLSEPSTTNTHKSQSLSLLTSTNQNTLEGSFHSGNRPENLFQAANRWTQIEESQYSNATQLSIAIPAAPSNFSSSSSPSRHDNPTIAPLALMSHNFNDTVPESTWESSVVGGPLGEVLNSSNTNYALTDHRHNNCASLNLSADSWDLCPNLNSSPTGVLQKNNFGSVSSSNASSPRPDNAVFFSDQPITLL